ncbi:MAG: nucleotidyltransferase family protein [Pleomorphochaeta sp.]
MENKIQKRAIEINDSILNALRIMDNKSVKLLLVFDKEQFINIITIGDLQRAIINNHDINDSIEKILDNTKLFASSEDSEQDIQNQMLAIRAECMPVLDNDGQLVKVYFWEDFFSQDSSQSRPKIDIPVVFMAGGKGTRLQPLTNVIPKPLIPIGEKTIAEVILDQFESIGCKKFYFSVNYKAEIIEYYFKNLPHFYDISFIKEDKPLGTIGSVKLMQDQIKSPFFVSNCDIIIDQDYRDVYDYHIQNKNDITIISSLKSYPVPYGVMETGEDGLLKSIKEKPNNTYMINTGVYILEPSLIDLIPEGEMFHITHLMEKVQQRGGRIGCFPVSEQSWTDIGDWKEYLSVIKK